jgi:hypothetical protein
MPTINRVRVAWSNFPGAPGLSTFYLADGTTDVTAIKTFFTAVGVLIPNGTTFQIPNSGDQIDPGTGKLTGTWTGTGGGSFTSTATAGAAFSGSSGAMVRWVTGAVVDGHRLVGRTYLVPLVGTNYDANGSLSSTAQTTIQNAANALVTSYAQNILVYHKHVDSDPDATPPVAGSPGVTSGITSAIVPDLAVVLRSRRV